MKCTILLCDNTYNQMSFVFTQSYQLFDVCLLGGHGGGGGAQPAAARAPQALHQPQEGHAVAGRDHRPVKPYR